MIFGQNAFCVFRWCCFSLALALGFFGVLRDTTAEQKTVVIATVNDEAILRDEMLLAMEFLPEQFQSLPRQELVPLVLEQLIDMKLLAQKADEEGLADDPRVVLRSKFYTMRLLYDYFATKIISDTITPEFLKMSYEKFLENFSAAEEVDVSHILVGSKKEALEIKELLDGGADFSDVATTYSIGPSASDGGALGYIRKQQVVPEFGNVAFSLRDGDYSEPVESEFGWHIILVSGRKDETPPSYSEIESKLRGEIANRLLEEAAQNARKNAKIEYFDLHESLLSDTELPQ